MGFGSRASCQAASCAPLETQSLSTMALRLGLRRFCSKPVPLGLPLKISPGDAVKKITSFSPGAFFEEKHFWKKAHLGTFVLALVFTPTIYRSIKDFYWTRQLKKLNIEEVISDRYEWLRISMIKDEVEAACLKQGVPAPLT